MGGGRTAAINHPLCVTVIFAPVLTFAHPPSQSVALVRLGPSWFGLVYPFTEGKRTNLMLSVLDHGATFPWLGAISALVDIPPKTVAKKSIWTKKTTSNDAKAKGGASVGPPEPSYAVDRAAASPVVRTPKQIQTDLQKILRLGGKLPNKREQCAYLFVSDSPRMHVYGSNQHPSLTHALPLATCGVQRV